MSPCDGIHAGSAGGLVAEIARKAQAGDARIAGDQFANDLVGAVAAAVIDENDFPFAAELFDDGGQAAMEFGQVILFVEERNDDGQEHDGFLSPGR